MYGDGVLFTYSSMAKIIIVYFTDDSLCFKTKKCCICAILTSYRAITKCAVCLYSDNSVYTIWSSVIFASFRNVHDSLLQTTTMPRVVEVEIYRTVSQPFTVLRFYARALHSMYICMSIRHSMKTMCFATNRSLNRLTYPWKLSIFYLKRSLFMYVCSK